MRSFTLVFFAIVASNVVAPALGATQTPIEKVITMLKELRTKVSGEGDKEAETYNKFACFCKDNSAEKSTAVEEGETLKDTLQADLNKLMSERETAGSDIQKLVQSISQTQDSLAVMRKERREQRLEYEGSEVDLTGAMQALEGAIRMLKATKKEVGFMELKPIAKTLQQAFLLAEGLGLEHQSSVEVRRAVSALVQEPEDVPTSVYEFHADDIVDTLEGLLKDFRDRKTTLDETEIAARSEHDKLVQDKLDSIKNDEKSIEDSKKAKAEAIARVATTSQDLTATSAQLLDDQKYLSELTTKCNGKAVIWDQRTQARADELQALTQALAIIETQQSKADAAGDDDDDLALVQQKQQAEPIDFLQVSVSQPAKHRTLSILANHAGRSLSNRERAVELLRAKAAKYKSALLSSLAAKAAKDPFAKIKTMIQELIERLLKQAASEASHKGWCDKEMGLAEQTRNQRAADIAEVNGAMAIGEARRDKLKELLVKLTDELGAITDTLEEAREMRTDEKEENAEATKEAQEAVDAVTEAMDILAKFYKTTAKASASLLIKSRAVLRRQAIVEDAPDAPEAGFDGAYTGAQGGKEGVMGMLEVIQSDFKRTIADIDKAEKASAQDFLEFETTTGSSKATKEVAKKAREAALNECEGELALNKEKLDSAQAALNKALEELQALHPACVGSPVSPEERKMQREEEMAALRQALCILDSQSSDSSDC